MQRVRAGPCPGHKAVQLTGLEQTGIHTLGPAYKQNKTKNVLKYITKFDLNFYWICFYF